MRKLDIRDRKQLTKVHLQRTEITRAILNEKEFNLKIVVFTKLWKVVKQQPLPWASWNDSQNTTTELSSQRNFYLYCIWVTGNHEASCQLLLQDHTVLAMIWGWVASIRTRHSRAKLRLQQIRNKMDNLFASQHSLSQFLDTPIFADAVLGKPHPYNPCILAYQQK